MWHPRERISFLGRVRTECAECEGCTQSSIRGQVAEMKAGSQGMIVLLQTRLWRNPAASFAANP